MTNQLLAVSLTLTSTYAFTLTSTYTCTRTKTYTNLAYKKACIDKDLQISAISSRVKPQVTTGRAKTFYEAPLCCGLLNRMTIESCRLARRWHHK